MNFDRLFHEVLVAAQRLGGTPVVEKDGNAGGMASVQVVWNPYECHWVGEANYSSGVRIQTTGSVMPTGAAQDLLFLLNGHIAELRKN
jgi:hypothetical protein